MGKIEKEKEDLKIDLRTSHMEISGLRQEVEKGKQEEKRLRQTIHQTDIDVGRLKKNIDNVMNERDILGTQVIRRNDEISLQYSRIKVCFLRKFYQKMYIFKKLFDKYSDFTSKCDNNCDVAW